MRAAVRAGVVDRRRGYRESRRRRRAISTTGTDAFLQWLMNDRADLVPPSARGDRGAGTAILRI